MIVISMLLVIVGAVTLVIGAFLRDDLTYVYVSIASCLAAGLFLVVGIIRSRPSRKPVLASGGEGQEASWSGASAWAGAESRDGGDAPAGTAVLDRDEDVADEPAVQVVEPEEHEEPAPPVDTERWQPAPSTAEPAAAREPAQPDEDEDVVVVTTRRGNGQQAGTVKKTAKKAARTSAKKAAKKAAGRSRGFDTVLSEIAGVGPAKRKALKSRFGSLDALRDASVKELTEVEGISTTLAERIHDHLH